MVAHSFKTILKALFITFLLLPMAMRAQVMQSGNFKIQSDTINFGGGLSTSTNFVVSDTLGEIGTGISSSTNFALNAGFQSMQASSISITDAANITLPNVGGISGGNSTGQSTWIVTTDDPAGYALSIVAATSPALKSAITSISNYVPAGANADFNFTVGAASSTFGFSPEGTDIIGRFKDNGSTCGGGTSNTADRCWDGIPSSPSNMARSNTSNQPNGATTTVKYQVGIGANKIQEAGTYTANITVTATAL